MAAVLRCLLHANLKQKSQKSKFGPILEEKSLNFEKFSINSSQKTRIEQFSNPPLSLEIKSLTQFAIFTHFSKNTENVSKNSFNTSKIHKTLYLDNSL